MERDTKKMPLLGQQEGGRGEKRLGFFGGK